MEQVKTVILLTSLTVLFVFIGAYLAGSDGALIAFLLAAGIELLCLLLFRQTSTFSL